MRKILLNCLNLIIGSSLFFNCNGLQNANHMQKQKYDKQLEIEKEAHEIGEAINKQIVVITTPNQNERIYKRAISDLNIGEGDKAKVEYLISHYTVSPKYSTIYTFLNEKTEVSSHFLIPKNNDIIIQLAHTKYRTWHGGRGKFNKNTNMNSCSIGIENIGMGYKEDYKKAVYRSLNNLYYGFVLDIPNRDKICNDTLGNAWKYFDPILDSCQYLYGYFYTPTKTFEGSSILWYDEWNNTLWLDKSIKLYKYLVKKYQILPLNVIDHATITNRKVDIGPMVPKEKFYENGVGAMPDIKSYTLPSDIKNHKQDDLVIKQMSEMGWDISKAKIEDDEKEENNSKTETSEEYKKRKEGKVVRFKMNYLADQNDLSPEITKEMCLAVNSLYQKYYKTNDWKKDPNYNGIYD